MADRNCLAIWKLLEIFLPVFTRPSFANMLVIVTGWILEPGAVTFALVATAASGQTHHEKYHRFFSRGTWEPDEMGKRIFEWLLRLMPADEPVKLVVDDTVARKKGAKVFGVDAHLDAVRSTKKYKVFCIGHCWVVVGVLVTLPFSKHLWCLPVLFRLYRGKKTCAKHRVPYKKKTELAREMLDIATEWADGRPVHLAGDSAYSNSTICKGLPEQVVVLGDMRSDAVLTAAPPKRTRKRGRPSQRGRKLAKPKVLARDSRRPWKTCEVTTYGQTRRIHYKECFAQWYRACGIQLLHIVLVKVESGTIGFRVFFSTDMTMTVEQVIEGYAGRWSIEVCFRNLKQLFGFANSSARKPEAVKRVAPFVGVTYSLLVLWFAEHAYQTPLAQPPIRPWYSHKSGLSFEDVIRAARRAISPNAFCDLTQYIDNLRNMQSDRPHALDRTILRKMAA